MKKLKPSSKCVSGTCEKCGNIVKGESTKLTEAEFVNLSGKCHGKKYDYSRVKYKGKGLPVKIICREHGEFLQTPKNHLDALGCPWCSCGMVMVGKKKARETFISRATFIHVGRYSYDKTKYTGGTCDLTISCAKHGDFIQSAYDHIAGAGCPVCFGYGFDYDREGFLYVLQSSCKSMMKIGITNDIEERKRIIRTVTPNGLSLIKVFKFVSGLEAYREAQRITGAGRVVVFKSDVSSKSKWMVFNQSIFPICK
ncbi:hypothetical protein C9J48_12190 [Photobacterium profundum]|uniref:Uncharacterized protein n=1 Tax=Photobacterium profundum 3TCK TaxID=314280 RepID=Q1Z5Z0_9GAMM|nr:hypothetical protein [Photobacterium profundum]EAS44054.1 hypothetical protein P3TCK_12736 [Photobacterium profundum 3TCK]PSV61758.1 hypothetical protein C9J48_12190 [Photobacterium profundum]